MYISLSLMLNPGINPHQLGNLLAVIQAKQESERIEQVIAFKQMERFLCYKQVYTIRAWW